MNTNTFAQDSAEIVITDWHVQIDDLGEPYSDEYEAPQTAWTEATSPADIWNSRTLTEWEM